MQPLHGRSRGGSLSQGALAELRDPGLWEHNAFGVQNDLGNAIPDGLQAMAVIATPDNATILSSARVVVSNHGPTKK